MQITLEDITKVYEGSGGKTPAVSDISLRIDSGEFFFLLGPSGCGKTTLLRMISGLLEPTAGSIYFDDREVSDLPVEKRNTAMVFQGYALWPHMTVLDNVAFGPKMQGVGRKQRHQYADEQLTTVQMNGFSRRKPNQLSGGQQQRVALARALAAKADCLLLDEPLSSLDARLRLHMRGELRRLVKSSGMTAVYVTHDQKEALSMADRIAVMDAGQIVQVGTPEQLYNQPDTRFVADFLGEANFIDGRLVETGPSAKVETPVGTLPVSDTKTMATGTAVTCCIRPEHITLTPDRDEKQSDDSASLPATIVSSMYLGEIRQYTCSLGEEDRIIWKISVLGGLSKKMNAGDRVILRIPADNTALLES
ncbi:MAG: ABC transporter ATP-binding protein [Desulfobacterales bacterium]